MEGHPRLSETFTTRRKAVRWAERTTKAPRSRRLDLDTENERSPGGRPATWTPRHFDHDLGRIHRDPRAARQALDEHIRRTTRSVILARVVQIIAEVSQAAAPQGFDMAA